MVNINGKQCQAVIGNDKQCQPVSRNDKKYQAVSVAGNGKKY